MTRSRHAPHYALLAASLLLCGCLPTRRTERPAPAGPPATVPSPEAGAASSAAANPSPPGPPQAAANAASAGNSTAPGDATQSLARPGAARPAPQLPRPKPLPPARSTLSAPAAKPAAAAPPALDLTALEQRLRDTSAIGVFTKLTLKNQVDDLLSRFRLYHSGHGDVKLEQLHQSYDLLLLKVLSLLQDKDAGLANAISASREAIWNILIDPKQFAAID